MGVNRALRVGSVSWFSELVSWFSELDVLYLRVGSQNHASLAGNKRVADVWWLTFRIVFALVAWQKQISCALCCFQFVCGTHNHAARLSVCVLLCG